MKEFHWEDRLMMKDYHQFASTHSSSGFGSPYIYNMIKVGPGPLSDFMGIPQKSSNINMETQLLSCGWARTMTHLVYKHYKHESYLETENIANILYKSFLVQKVNS